MKDKIIAVFLAAALIFGSLGLGVIGAAEIDTDQIMVSGEEQESYSEPVMVEEPAAAEETGEPVSQNEPDAGDGEVEPTQAESENTQTEDVQTENTEISPTEAPEVIQEEVSVTEEPAAEGEESEETEDPISEEEVTEVGDGEEDPDQPDLGVVDIYHYVTNLNLYQNGNPIDDKAVVKHGDVIRAELYYTIP
ncbi:MAG: hypothetical protein Q4B26_21075, partial [Eubacteriales bacterium]|nr:hypothetical protein [Eubacteriales bacterium]